MIAHEASFDAALADANTRLSGGDTSDGGYEAELDSMINNSGQQTQDRVYSQNLSDILKNIRDFGPAGSVDRSRRTTESVRAESVPADRTRGTHSPAAAQRSRTPAGHEAGAGNGRKPVKQFWHAMTLFMLVAIAMLIVLLQHRTDTGISMISSGLEQAVEDYDRQITRFHENGMDFASGQTLEDLQRALNEIDGRIRRIDSRLDRIGVHSTTGQARIVELLKKEIEPQLQQIKTVDLALSRAATGLADQGKAERPGAAVTTGEKPAAGDWVVNLVSLSDRARAQKAYARLRDADFAALINEVEINGKLVYRLSVVGFDSRQSAQRFINTAAKQHGFDKGWIRRGLS